LVTWFKPSTDLRYAIIAVVTGARLAAECIGGGGDAAEDVGVEGGGAISRGREDARLYTDDKSLLPEAMSRIDRKAVGCNLQRRRSANNSRFKT
jgi:hypothetical protein